MYQQDSVCLCEIERHFVDHARVVDYATGSTRGVCTECSEHVHVEVPETRTCIACGKTVAADENGDLEERFARLQRGDFNLEDASDDNINAEYYVCEKCWLEDVDLCRFFNRFGLRSR